MSSFRDTPAGDEFIATAGSRETSIEIMEAIAFFAKDAKEAETLWEGDGLGVICSDLDLWERVTKNGLIEADSFAWGAAGFQWWDEMNVPQSHNKQ